MHKNDRLALPHFDVMQLHTVAYRDCLDRGIRRRRLRADWRCYREDAQQCDQKRSSRAFTKQLHVPSHIVQFLKFEPLSRTSWRLTILRTFLNETALWHGFAARG